MEENYGYRQEPVSHMCPMYRSAGEIPQSNNGVCPVCGMPLPADMQGTGQSNLPNSQGPYRNQFMGSMPICPILAMSQSPMSQFPVFPMPQFPDIDNEE